MNFTEIPKLNNLNSGVSEDVFAPLRIVVELELGRPSIRQPMPDEAVLDEATMVWQGDGVNLSKDRRTIVKAK